MEVGDDMTDIDWDNTNFDMEDDGMGMDFVARQSQSELS